MLLTCLTKDDCRLKCLARDLVNVTFKQETLIKAGISSET